MKIKNYTSIVPVIESIGSIQGKLVEIGARQISIDYDEEGNPDAVRFQLTSKDGMPGQIFKLPTNWKGIKKVFDKNPKIYGRLSDEQAKRVAWRILFDWVRIQGSMIECEQAEAVEVFLPYMMQKGGKTVYQLYKMDSLKQLEEGKSGK